MALVQQVHEYIPEWREEGHELSPVAHAKMPNACMYTACHAAYCLPKMFYYYFLFVNRYMGGEKVVLEKGKERGGDEMTLSMREEKEERTAPPLPAPAGWVEGGEFPNANVQKDLEEEGELTGGMDGEEIGGREG